MPPELEDNIADMDDLKVVDEVVKDDADASKEVEKSAEADPSTATDAKKTEGSDSLSIVRDVVGKAKEPAAASSAIEDQGKKTPPAPKERDDENYTDVPFNKHPRFQEVLGKLKTAEVDAGRYRNVQSFLDQQGLGAEEAAELLIIGGLIKTNPAAAWERMKSKVQQVLIAAGEVLPDDLKAMVGNGEMSREAAMQVSRSRAQLESLRVSQQFGQQQAQAREQANAAQAIQNAVGNWESERRLRDPNFEAKMPALQREIAYLQATEGKPTTAEGVRAQLEKAYGALAPIVAPQPRQQQKRAITPITGGQVSGNVKPEIKGTLDVVNAVIARRRAG